MALPLVLCNPLQLPEAVQLAVLMDDQLIVVVPPACTDAGESESEGGPGGRSFSAASAWMNP